MSFLDTAITRLYRYIDGRVQDAAPYRATVDSTDGDLVFIQRPGVNDADAEPSAKVTADVLSAGDEVMVLPVLGKPVVIGKVRRTESMASPPGHQHAGTGADSIALGDGATSNFANGVAVGDGATSADDSTAIGTGASAGWHAVAVGRGAVSHPQGVAIGRQASAPYDRAIAIGLGAVAGADQAKVMANEVAVERSNGSGATTIVLQSPGGTWKRLQINDDNTITVTNY